MVPDLVILGGSGFIGKALVGFAQQHYGGSVAAHDSVTLNLLSPDSVEHLCDSVGDHTVLIVTARSRHTEDRRLACEEDVGIAVAVARCLSRRRVRKCVYCSTSAVYGDDVPAVGVTEEAVVAPSALYAVGKFAGECIIHRSAVAAGIPSLILRPCMVYGPGDTSSAYGPARFIQSVLRDGTVSLFGDGGERRDYLFVRDLAALTLELAMGSQHGTFNVASGRAHSVRDVVDILHRVAGRKIRVMRLKRPRPKVDQTLDVGRLLRALPCFRFTELPCGLAETWQYEVERPRPEAACHG